MAQQDCPICLSSLSCMDVSVLTCKHSFHAVCVGRHVATIQRRGTERACPLCRAPIDAHDVFKNYLTCVRTGTLDDVEACLKNIKDVNMTDYWGVTALHVAASRGDLSLVTYLIYMGANVNARAKQEHTPLYLAAMRGHLNVVKYLLLRGANVLIGRQGKSPSTVALEQRHYDVASYLMGAADGLMQN